MAYQILETRTFRREFRKVIPVQLQGDLRRRIDALAENPYAQGKPLRFPWFRELKAKTFRIYYVIEERTVTVMLAGASNKKGQEQAIARIISKYQWKH